jgi:hypothetical protein
MGFLKPKSPTLVPTPTPDQVLTPGETPPSSSPARQNRAPSFLADAALPPPSQGNTGGKTLLGQ